MYGIKVKDRVPSKEMRLEIDDIISILQQNKLRWYGQMLCKENNEWAIYIVCVFVSLITCFLLLLVTCFFFLLLIFSFLSYFTFNSSIDNSPAPFPGKML